MLMTIEENYRLSCYEELTALGNHNNIYLVKDKLSDKIFVKKVLSRFSFDIYEQLKNLKIHGIPMIHDMILDQDRLILIEDYIHGQTLEQLLDEQGTLSETDACNIILKLCDILKCLHGLNPPIIHRDLKLSNIIVTSEQSLYIIDFDTARYHETGQDEDTELLGTKEYAPPEQYGFGQSDIRSDIYALGIIFNRLLTREYPKHHLTSGKYHSIISKCIRWDPEERFQSVELLKADLTKQSHPLMNAKISKSSSFIEDFRLPGFRSGKPWKMLIALMGYIFCFYCCTTITITETQSSVPLTGSRLWYERTFMFIIFLTLIFYNCDYRNMRTLSLRGHSFPLWMRILIQCGISILIVLFLMLIMLIFEGIIW